MLPMGTIMACSMFLGLLLAILKNLPDLIKKPLGFLVLAAGLWNVCWYAVQHLTEFWGQAALVSGILMIITAFYIIDETRLPAILVKLKPLVLLLLLGCGLLYGITIYRL